MEELKLTGNHLKGSRPLLTFSTNFDEQPHWKLVKEMLTQVHYYFDNWHVTPYYTCCSAVLDQSILFILTC
jgi:hypothetical protein